MPEILRFVLEIGDWILYFFRVVASFMNTPLNRLFDGDIIFGFLPVLTDINLPPIYVFENGALDALATGVTGLIGNNYLTVFEFSLYVSVVVLGITIISKAVRRFTGLD